MKKSNNSLCRYASICTLFMTTVIFNADQNDNNSCEHASTVCLRSLDPFM